MALQPRTFMAVAVLLIVLLAVTNALWYLSYRKLEGNYAKVEAELNATQGDLAKAETLLSLYDKLTGIYQNLTKVMNLTILALRASQAAIVANLSLQLTRDSIELTEMAENLTILANTTTDPTARVVYAQEASAAMGVVIDMLKGMYVMGKELGLNQTYFNYIESAEAAANNISGLALSVKTSPNPRLAAELAASVGRLTSSVIAAETQLMSALRAPQQTQSTS